MGAWGDDASVGNMGVSVEIRTSVFPLASQDLADYFWAGDNLRNGTFIQFGYQLVPPGYYCLYAHVVGDQETCFGSYSAVGTEDARWFWAYFQNGTVNDFYFGLGPKDSADADGSWHLYQILPNTVNGWNFLLDGQTVWSLNDFKVQRSESPAFLVAEEVTNATSPSGSLGPVEFRNLSYWNQNGWRQVQSSTAISGCGGLNLNCGISIPYGVTVLGANDVIVGTGEQVRETGSLLWSPATQTAVVTVPAQTTQALYATAQGTAALYPQVELTPAGGITGTQVHVRGSGFMSSDTSCTISSPTSPNVIFGNSGACTIQSGTGVVIGEFIVGIIQPGSYVVQVTGNQGDVGQTTIVVE